jgi:ribosomal protein L32
MICIKCQDKIHPGRLKALPGTKTCVRCSTTGKWYVRNVISGKTTYAETEIIKDPETAKSLAAMDKRAGWGSNLYKVRG